MPQIKEEGSDSDGVEFSPNNNNFKSQDSDAFSDSSNEPIRMNKFPNDSSFNSDEIALRSSENNSVMFSESDYTESSMTTTT